MMADDDLDQANGDEIDLSLVSDEELNDSADGDDAGMEAWEERGYPYVTGD